MQFPELTHHIQLTILRNMLQRQESRYSDIKPRDVEANLFMYHMKQLMRIGLIEKRDGRYVLTRQGKLFADRVTLESMKIRVQPKIVSILCIKRDDDKWLILRRKHQPFTNYVGFPSGKMHYGETLAESAKRELLEKTTLTDIKLTLRGNVAMRFLDGEEVVNHIVGYVFYGEVSSSVQVSYQSKHFDSFFGEEAELFEEPCFKGHREILNYLRKDNNLFVEESEYTSDY